MGSRPTLVFAHGSWHSPEHFKPIIKDLERHGYRCVNVGLPSTQTPDSPPAGLADDTEVIRSAIIAELHAGHNVVVVAHSYGGTPANNALKDLDLQSRQAAGESSAVTAIAFINAIPVPSGMSFLQIIGGKPGPIHDLRTPEFAWVGAPGAEHYFYNEMEPEDAKYWASLLRQQSWLAYEDRTSYAAYMDVPCYYLSCTKDQAFPYEAQAELIGAIESAGGKIKKTTLEGDHTPFLGKLMGETSEFIRNAAHGRLESLGAKQ